jgi:hypothetical protein
LIQLIARAGSYRDSSGDDQVFVVNETHGTWRAAREIPGTATLNGGGFATAFSVSCAPAGNCAAGGSYTDNNGRQQAFVVSRR